MKKSFLAGFLCMLVILSAFTCANAAPVQWTVEEGGNGHWYEIINTSITWDDVYINDGIILLAIGAKTAAERAGGYLVTVTSAAENLFLTNNSSLGGEGNDLLESHWLGGYQPNGSGEPAGGWTWVNNEGLIDYDNWAGSYDEYGNYIKFEPSNSEGNENYLVFQHQFSIDGKMWNDISGVTAEGYVIEYDTQPVPIPGALWLLGSGLVGLISIRRKL